MKTYKEQYRRKKTQPLVGRQKFGTSNHVKEPVKQEKVSTIRSIPVHRRHMKDRFSNHPLEELREAQQREERDQHTREEKSPKRTIKEHPEQQTPYTRSHSISIVQKFTPSPSYAPLNYQKRTTIQNLQKINILHSVQNFFNRLVKPDNGCICEQPCQWASKLFRWVDIPEFLVTKRYEQLKQKVKLRARKKQHQQLQYFQSIQDQQKDIQIQKSFNQIKKDIPRTQSQSLTFQSTIFRHRLQAILKCYVIEDPKLGYVQGMNMILSGILYHVKEQPKTYGIFRKLLYSIRSVYLDNFRECYIHINRIEHLLKMHLLQIFAKLGEMQIQLNMICLPWVLSLLTSIVPLDSLHLIYEGFMKEKWHFIYKVSLSIFAYFKQEIRQATQASQILMIFSSGQDRFNQIDWEDVIKFSETIEVNFNNI